MRGTTIKRLRKFAEYLIENTSPEELAGRSKAKLTKDLKIHWKNKGKTGQKFVHDALKGKFEDKKI